MPSGFDYDAHYAKLAANPPYLSKERLPKGYKIGRCLFVVDGQRRISGPCAYIIEKGGDFHIAGPRQVYDGIDYPKAEITAAELSTDYWADVFQDRIEENDKSKIIKGSWTGYGNEDEIRSVHGQGSRWGKLTRNGACYSNRPGADVVQLVKICLWKN